MNQAGFATLVLTDAGLPTSYSNISNITRWMAAEEPPDRWWTTNDPLNLGHPTTDPSGALASLEVAAQLTAQELTGNPDYRAIRNALAATAPLSTFSAAVVYSPWSADHYGGTPQYLARIPLPALVTAPGTPPPAPPPTRSETDTVLIIRTATTGPTYLLAAGRLVPVTDGTTLTALQKAGIGTAELTSQADFAALVKALS